MNRNVIDDLNRLQALGEKIKLDFGVKTKPIYLGPLDLNKEDEVADSFPHKVVILDTASYVAKKGKEVGMLDIGKEAQEICDEYVDTITESECLDRLRSYQSSFFLSESLLALIKNICKNVDNLRGKNVDFIYHTFLSILDKIKNNIKTIGYSLYTKIHRLFSKFKEIATQGVESFISWINEILDELVKYINLIVTLFFDFSSFINGIALKKNFSLKEISIKIIPFKVKSMLLAGIPIIIPIFETPEITFKFGLISKTAIYPDSVQ